ncbi:DUF5057 domain-containing protein [Paenibacillus sp. PK3_47]|uniref:DUF5057 domain-containing protein n=1 Tax=Paenibacillus sp. PK3_47 TaxID=2072642 RepID=UPI00201DF446|nr:DUF5057 domain-containing protein [Paenibacillus sp. PK3_47]
MKMFKQRRFVFLSGAAALVLLIVLLVQLFSPNVEASDNNYPIRILEITDPTSASLGADGSELDELKQLSNVTVDTVTMKKFVSLREDWDGKYDAIYVGRGNFNKALIASNSSTNDSNRDKAHNTLAVQNDITSLKAKEIIDYYINKGLYVFFQEETFSAQAKDNALQGKLYTSFNVYRTASGQKANVLFLTDNSRNNLISVIKNRTSPYITGLTRRPQLTITNKSEIKSYLTNAAETYQQGDSLIFKIKLGNVPNISASPVKVRLYMNVDSSIPMTEDHVVASLDMNSNEGTLRYTLPETYSGPLYWKLEVTDTSTNLKAFDRDVIRFTGVRPEIKVLQVMPSGRSDSSLLNSINMNQSYLNNSNYQLSISTMNMGDFNTYIKNSSSPQRGLNGVYDMIVFGFQDMYDRVTSPMISKEAAQAVFDFANSTKQSIMLTHDTIFIDDPKDSNYWGDYFRELVGQTSRTYLGGNAVNPSSKVVPVNNGLLTQYPFNLNSAGSASYPVAQTHDQFFMLDLERADVVPWYNIKSESNKTQRDIDDSYNHFYTYSVGSITFSGTGHSKKGNINSDIRFPDWEQKLFVNTMYRAFVGANHAPKITVNAPAEGSIIPSYANEILVDFSAKDFDLNDNTLSSSIRFKTGGNYINGLGVDNISLKSGQTISRSFTNPLNKDGDLQIEIKVWDSQGAMATEIINVKVKEATASVLATRSLPASLVNNEVIRGKDVAVTYTVTPQPIPFAQANIAANVGDSQLISNISFMDNVPAGLEIKGASTPITSTGSAATGYSVSKKLDDIRYTLQSGANGVKTFVPDAGQEVTFTITVSPQKAGKYLFGTASLQYDEIHAATEGSLLGAVRDYNLVVVGLENTAQSTTISNLSIKGRVAISGNVDFRNIGGGAEINNGGTSSQDALVVGGDLYYNNNITINGNAVYGGNYYYNGNADTQSIRGKVLKGSPIDFASLRERMTSLSAKLATLNDNGSMKSEYGTVTLTGTSDAKLYVFSVPADVISSAHSLNVSVPQGSTVLVNIGNNANGTDGSKYVKMALNTNLTGVEANHILYNFPSAETVDLRNTLNGTFLAPRATVGFDNGQLTGQVIAGAASRMTTLFYSPFNGTIPLNEAPVRGSVLFSPLQLTLNAVIKVESITLPNTEILLNDKPWPITPVIGPEDATNKKLTWSSADPQTVYVDPSTGNVTGKKVSSNPVEITAAATDGSGVVGKALVTVKDRTLRIEGKDSVKPKINLALTAIYETILEDNITYRWVVNDKEGKDVSSYITATDQNATFNAPSSGAYTVTVYVSSDKVKDVFASKTIIVANPLESLTITGNGNSMPVKGSLDLTANLKPGDADGTDLEWLFVNPDDSQYAELRPVPGTNQVQMIAKGIPGKTIQVIVKDKITGITSPPYSVSITGLNGLEFSKFRHTMYVGDTFNLMDLLWTIPRTISLESIQNDLTWTSDKPNVASFANSKQGVITGNKKGSVIVTVTYSIPGLDPVTATIEVVVENRQSNLNEGDRY